MGRPPCCDKSNVKRGPWTAEEDAKMLAYVAAHGAGNWTLVPKKAGLNRCGKSCRLRWTNYLRPDLNHTGFTPHEEDLILRLHLVVGSRWSLIARHLPGRTDNDVKNYWNTKLRKKLTQMGIDPITHKPLSQLFTALGTIVGLSSTPVGRTTFSPPPLLPPSMSPILTEFERNARFVPYSYLIGNMEINPSSLLVNFSSHDEHSTVQCYDFNDGNGEMWGRCNGGHVVRNNTDEGKKSMKTDNSGSSVSMEEDVSMDSSFSYNILDWMDDEFHGLLAHVDGDDLLV